MGIVSYRWLYNITHCPESSVYDSLGQYNGITYMYLYMHVSLYWHRIVRIVQLECVYAAHSQC